MTRRNRTESQGCPLVSDPLNIAFSAGGGDGWRGGLELLKNQLLSLKQAFGKAYTLSVLVQNGAYSQLSDLADTVIHVTYPRRYSASWFVRIGSNYVSRALLQDDRFIGSVLRKNGVSAVCGIGLTSRYDGIPSLSWLSDFQQIHLPQMFTDEQRRIRNESYLQSAENSSLVLLFSEAVKRDFEKFAPQYAYKARIIHPVAHIPSWVYDHDPSSIVRAYSLPTKFVYLPNAFWKHKNHELAFGAVHDLSRQGVGVVVVCDGYSEDYRHPGYFSELWRKVSQWGIRDQAIYAGLLPHDHMLTLMRQSVCVLNPSLFEGWGMTVEEARSLGKRVLISDIPAHREQNPPNATYFDPNDREDLVDKLKQIWNETEPGPDLELEAASRGQARERISHNAEVFISLIQEAVKE